MKYLNKIKILGNITNLININQGKKITKILFIINILLIWIYIFI